MATVRDHYDAVLSEHYSRMFGDFEAKVVEQRALLEYERSTVKVHDLIWVRHPDGWRFRAGVYRKLRLAAEEVAARLAAAGFTVERHEAPPGLITHVGVLAGPRRARQCRHGRMASGRGSTSGGTKTARYPSAGASHRKSI